jgi:dienelactone hydrolase
MQTNVILRPVGLLAGEHLLRGDLAVPDNAAGIVLFAHGSGSSRLSPRNRFVAEVLQQAGLATLLFDLLDENEAEDRHKVFDIELLAQRLLLATKWLHEQPQLHDLKTGYFGASTGSAAALVAAAHQRKGIAAVVSRGGRPDLADDALIRVEAPTLLIVGSDDDTVVQLNRRALHKLHCPKELAVVQGATHLFEEPGTLDEVARLASNWFQKYLQEQT